MAATVAHIRADNDRFDVEVFLDCDDVCGSTEKTSSGTKTYRINSFGFFFPPAYKRREGLFSYYISVMHVHEFSEEYSHA